MAHTTNVSSINQKEPQSSVPTMDRTVLILLAEGEQHLMNQICNVGGNCKYRRDFVSNYLYNPTIDDGQLGESSIKEHDLQTLLAVSDELYTLTRLRSSHALNRTVFSTGRGPMFFSFAQISIFLFNTTATFSSHKTLSCAFPSL